MNILFFGTPSFAAIHLNALLNAGIKIQAVFTRPDKPSGRGQKLKASPVKLIALEKNIPLYQPASLKKQSIQDVIRQLNPNVIIDVAFGLLVPKAVLDIPKHGVINVHPSLLPKWRGAAPIQGALLAGDRKTGVTIMKMDEGWDTGPILLQEKCEIKATDTAASLHDQLAKIGSSLLLKAVCHLDSLTPIMQDHSQASYIKKIKKEDSRIDWRQSAKQISRQVRAYYSWPIAFAEIGGEIVKIVKAQIVDEKTNEATGIIVKAEKEGVFVATGDGVLQITKMQFAGGKALNVADILNSKKSFFLVNKRFNV